MFLLKRDGLAPFSMALVFSCTCLADDEEQFNTSFLQGAPSSVDLQSLLATSRVLPGIYRVDLYGNETLVGRALKPHRDRITLCSKGGMAGDVHPPGARRQNGAQNHIFDLGRVDQSLADRYARSLRLAGLRPVAAAALLRIIFDLHELRHHLPTARLSFEPWPGRSPFSVAGAKYVAGENRTPRIPEAIITPLLAWSLRFSESAASFFASALTLSLARTCCR